MLAGKRRREERLHKRLGEHAPREDDQDARRELEQGHPTAAGESNAVTGVTEVKRSAL